MGKPRLATLTVGSWLHLAGTTVVQQRIATDSLLDIYPILIADAASRKPIYWEDAVVLLHLVYAWMPTMLRTERLGALTTKERKDVVRLLDYARGGYAVSIHDLTVLTKFANDSLVGASKLLHILNPDRFPIWDTRVAGAFLWKGVTFQTLNSVPRYCQYQSALQMWLTDSRVVSACATLRSLSSSLTHVSQMRLMELVLFRSAK